MTPTFAAAAQFFGKAGVGVDESEWFERAMEFAEGELASALVMGDRLGAEREREVAERLAGFIGLPVELVLARHLLHGEYIAAACAFASFHKLLGDGDIRIHKVVGKDNSKRFVPDSRTGTQNSVPETERLRLANVDAGNPDRDDVSKRFEKLRFALFL